MHAQANAHTHMQEVYECTCSVRTFILKALTTIRLFHCSFCPCWCKARKQDRTNQLCMCVSMLRSQAPLQTMYVEQADVHFLTPHLLKQTQTQTDALTPTYNTFT